MVETASRPGVSAVCTALSDAGSDFEVVPSQTPSPRSSQAGSWDTGSSVSETDDMVYHFKQAGIPSSDNWARKIHNAGYDLEMLHEANLDELAKELCMPSGIKMKLERLRVDLRAGEVTGMPSGLDDVPVQTPASGTPWMRLYRIVMTVFAASGTPWMRLYWIFTTMYAAVLMTVLLADVAAGVPCDKCVDSRPPSFAPTAVFGLLVVATAPVSLPFLLVTAAIVDCIDGDALITMADRKKKKIRHLKKGDKVLAVHKQKYKVKTVIEVKASENATVYPLELRNARGERIQVNATGGHPFYAQGKGWSAIAPDDSKFSKPVSKLQKGDKLIMRGGKTAEVLGIGRRTSMPTYNLILDGQGAFLVHDILSHSGLPSLDAKVA